MDQPQSGKIRCGAGFFDFAKGGYRLFRVPGEDMSFAEVQPGILGVFHAALGDTSLDERGALFGLTHEDAFHAGVDQAEPGMLLLCLPLGGGKGRKVVGSLFFRHVAQPTVAVGLVADAQQAGRITLLDDTLRLGRQTRRSACSANSI